MDKNGDEQDTLQDMARDLPDLAGRLGSMKEEALARLYFARVRHAAAEAGGGPRGGGGSGGGGQA